jgi:hypothetical protein
MNNQNAQTISERHRTSVPAIWVLALAIAGVIKIVAPLLRSLLVD